LTLERRMKIHIFKPIRETVGSLVRPFGRKQSLVNKNSNPAWSLLDLPSHNPNLFDKGSLIDTNSKRTKVTSLAYHLHTHVCALDVDAGHMVLLSAGMIPTYLSLQESLVGCLGGVGQYGWTRYWTVDCVYSRFCCARLYSCC
jgi:hypothetical protein